MENKLREYIARLRGKAARYYTLATNDGCFATESAECWGKSLAYYEVVDELENMLPQTQTEEEKTLGY